MTQWPDDERMVPLEDEPEGAALPDDPERAVEELHAEQPVPLDDTELHGDGPDDSDVV